MALPEPAADRTAVVTGASSGIGEAIARDLAARGHGVSLVARSAGKLESLAEELVASGVRAEVVPADLSDASARAKLPERIAGLGLVADVVVNNAGFSTLGAVAGADPADELRMIEVDVAAVADLCTRFVPPMVERGRGAVLNVASTAAFQPLPGQAAYGASKAFVRSYTLALWGELRGTGVSATVLCPGPVETGFGAAAGFSAEEESMMPRFMWESAADVARTGLDALAAGRPVAIPGLANRAGAAFGHLSPKRLLVPWLAGRHPGVD